MPDTAIRPLGIFGGTFDPVHFGHLRLAEEAHEALGLTAICWVPAGQPPHRASPRIAPRHRLAMVRLAVAGNPHFRVAACEMERAEPSYTVTTLSRLRREQGPRQPLVLLMGADAFTGLASWYCWQEIFGLAHLAVLHRPGYPLLEERLPEPLAREFVQRRCAGPADLALAPAGAILPLPMTQLDISATHIRSLLSRGASPRYLLPDEVLDYIRRHQLYRNQPNP
ncbi:MAG: nicotinate-nucleotide adenylyltransferase [Azovibrio sp.]|uniref:nicotinate-nucleotide adenylyltransferase n=1 Tax=Azovibrio sp. TaxID=1872673 RepID=UPI003C76D346